MSTRNTTAERMRGARFGLALLAGAWMAAAAAAVDPMEFEDEIHLKAGGRAIAGIKIIEDSWKGVRYKLSNPRLQPQRVDITDVERVRYAEVTSVWTKNVKRIVVQRYFTNGIKYFTKRIDKIAEYPWSGQYVYYYLGKAHLDRSDPDKNDFVGAREYFGTLISKYPQSRHIFAAYLGIGDSYRWESKYDEAMAAYETAKRKFAAMAGETGNSLKLAEYCRRQGYFAEYWRIKVIEEQGDYGKAKSLYERLQSNARRHSDIVAYCRAGVLRCLLQNGEFDRAIREANKMIEDAEQSGDERVLSGAYVGLGDCYYQKKDYRRARYNYLRVIVLHFDDEDYLVEAHFKAALCYQKLVGSERDAAARARRHFRILVERYDGSREAMKAKEMLSRNGGGGGE